MNLSGTQDLPLPSPLGVEGFRVSGFGPSASPERGSSPWLATLSGASLAHSLIPRHELGAARVTYTCTDPVVQPPCMTAT